MLNRRCFLKSTVVAGALAATDQASAARRQVTPDQLERAAKAPILKLDGLKSPVKIASIELLRGRGVYFTRARSVDGAEGLAVTNNRAAYLYPIFNKLVAPFFVGKDARKLESLIDGVYLTRSNYKLSGVALWCCVAWAEFSLLDMLGRIARKPVGELLGGVIRRKIPIYVASGRRNTTPQQEVALLAKSIERVGAKAVKLKVGGRMSNNADSIPGRSEGLIPLARKTLGDSITIYGDANGSYDAKKGIEIGKLMQDNGYGFFEEPCPFDHLDQTKRVADALKIPVAGGEQETSARRFRWMIHNGAVQVVQPDLHYNGGFIRAARVARMAAAADLPIVLHMSGGGVGDVDVLHFVSCTPNAGDFQEYKGGVEKSGKWYDPPLKLKDGAVTVPSGPGLGLPAGAAIFRNAKPIASA